GGFPGSSVPPARMTCHPGRHFDPVVLALLVDGAGGQGEPGIRQRADRDADDAEVFAGPCIDGAAAAWTEARGERVPFLGRARVLARLARNRNAVCRVVGDLAERGAAAPLAVEAVAQDDHGLGPLRD